MSHIYHRQLDILNPLEINLGVSIIGCGSIGSYTALTLSKMGIKELELIDYDTVEIHNIPNQIYRITDLGRYKVEALRDIIKELSPDKRTVIVRKERFKEDTNLTYPIVIVCTDNMESRRLVYSYWKQAYDTLLYVDARTNAESCHIHAFTKDNLQAQRTYENVYLTHKDVNGICTAQSIIYNVVFIASMIGNIVKKFFNEEHIPRHIFYNFKDCYYSVE